MSVIHLIQSTDYHLRIGFLGVPEVFFPPVACNFEFCCLIYRGFREMLIEGIERTRKRIFTFSVISMALPVITAFAVVDIIEGDRIEALVDILIGIFIVAAYFGIRKFEADIYVYRILAPALSILFFFNVTTGSGYGTTIYWLYPFPLLFLFLLGKMEGAIACSVFLAFLSFVMFNPFSFDLYSYDVGITLRFLASMLFVTFMAYMMESAREKYGLLLIEKNNKLRDEKENLQRALAEVKTLSGLIPICSNCKKIRDDSGYWQQVEIYVRNHSKAEFSHGLCPDCLAELYPEFTHLLNKK